jgi:hypothetical protein
VNTVRGIEEIFELLIDINNVPEWINPYMPVYHDANIINNTGDVIFEKRYSISVKRVVREIVAEKSKKSRKRKKRNRIF